jgi:hypothetical protein
MATSARIKGKRTYFLSKERICEENGMALYTNQKYMIRTTLFSFSCT